MPDAYGKLTAADFTTIQDWMSQYNGGLHPCPICQSTSWSIGDSLVQPVTLGPNTAIQLSGIGYPNVFLISPCGYTRFMNAVLMGILKPNTQTPEVAKDKN